MVAGDQVVHIGADFLDDARSLMAEHRRRSLGDGPVHGRYIGMANPGVGDLDGYIIGAQIKHLDVIAHVQIDLAHFSHNRRKH